MEEELIKSRQTMKEQLETDKWDETCPLTRGKKAKVCNQLIGLYDIWESHSFSDPVHICL